MDVALVVAGVALMTLGWLRWRLVAVGSPWRRGTLRGRHGTWRHLHALCVAGVAFMTLGWLRWRAWSPLVARGAVALCVAGVALGNIYLHFAWQAALHGRRGSWRHSWRHGRRICVALACDATLVSPLFASPVS